MMDPEFQSLHVQDGSLEDIRQSRSRMLLDLLVSFDPDLIVTELFPFGRRQFRFELTPLLKAAKQRPRPAKVVCSLRDILVEKKGKPNYETEVVDTLNSCYDLLLIHSDPRVVMLEETFGRCGEIGVQVEYTGFVARPPGTQKESGREKSYRCKQWGRARRGRSALRRDRSCSQGKAYGSRIAGLYRSFPGEG